MRIFAQVTFAKYESLRSTSVSESDLGIASVSSFLHRGLLSAAGGNFLVAQEEFKEAMSTSENVRRLCEDFTSTYGIVSSLSPVV